MYLSSDQLSYLKPHQPTFPYRVQSILEKGSSELNEDVLLNEAGLFGVLIWRVS